MDLLTLATVAGYAVFYVIGKAIGRSEGRKQGLAQQLTPLCMTVEMNGDVIGAVHLAGMRLGHARDDAEHTDGDNGPTDGPPPGHPEKL